jgi:hypothetical protein
MRMSTLMTSTLSLLSGVLIFMMSGISIWLWHTNAITIGAIAFSIGLTLRLKAMSQWIIWEVAACLGHRRHSRYLKYCARSPLLTPNANRCCDRGNRF